MYKELNIETIIEAINLLKLRIKDRFPEANWIVVCNELRELATKCKINIYDLNKPYIYFRISFYLIIIIAIASILFTFSMLKIDLSILTFDYFITVSESLLNEIVMIGASFYFLFKLEDIIKQKKILIALQELRTIAHIIDMHQLTKDPSNFGLEKTRYSPKRELTKDQLSKYLDYCSEMLSLTSKVAAIYGFNNRDQLVLETIHNIEILSSSLSSKIWQKIELNNLLK